MANGALIGVNSAQPPVPLLAVGGALVAVGGALVAVGGALVVADGALVGADGALVGADGVRDIILVPSCKLKRTIK